MDEDQQQVELHRKVSEAAAIRAMCQMPGFALLRKGFEERVKKNTTRLLDARTSDEDAAKIRRNILLWTEIENMLKHLMLTGDFSAKMLRQFEDIDANTTPAGFQAGGQGEIK